MEQSHISPTSSQAALNLSRPVIVFSSHNPSGCYFEHAVGGTREYTVQSVQSGYGGTSMVLDIYEAHRVRIEITDLFTR